MNEFNLSFFIPKKDECSKPKCFADQHADEERKKKLQQEYDVHEEGKHFSHQEKSDDKNNISTLYKVACFELEAVLPTSRHEVSSFCYKSK